MPYTLAYKDRYKRVDESSIISDTSDSVAFASIPDNEPTRLLVEWTGKQYTKLLSAVYTGANLMFPDDANEIIWQLMKVVHQPIPFELPEGSGCIEYSPSASFIRYFPDNPYISGDTSAGWNKEAWFKWNEFDTIFPDWIDNWLGGVIEAITGYQAGDILFNIESIPINPIDAFLSGGGILPKIEIRFTGAGVVEVELLSFPLGGKAIIELDNEPNVLDILTGGILDPDAFLVELSRDIVNFPPDEYPVNNIEIPVTTTGAHVLYIVFIPIVDDALLPIGFGGGVRGVELCGFEEEGIVSGIESIVWDGCELKSVSGGIETVIVTAAQIQDCLDLPPPSGGGGGGGGIAPKVYTKQLGANLTTTSTTYIHEIGVAQIHNFTKANALIMLSLSAQNNANQPVDIKLRMDTGTILYGRDGTIGRVGGAALVRELAIVDVFEDIPEGNNTLAIEWRVAAQTGTIFSNVNLIWTIIEYDNASDIFVSDIQVLSNGDIQKMIGGVWITVAESLAAKLASIQATASAANAAAAAAQVTANGAVAVNATQTGLINAITALNTVQNGRLDVLENDLGDLVAIDIPQINTTLANHETRLDALEAGGGVGEWGGMPLGIITHLSLSGYDAPYSSFDTNPSTQGWIPTSLGAVEVYSPNANRLGAVAFVRIGVNCLAGFTGEVRVIINDGEEGLLIASVGSGSNISRWFAVPTRNYPNMKIFAFQQGGGAGYMNWRLRQATYACINWNPFTLEVL